MCFALPLPVRSKDAAVPEPMNPDIARLHATIRERLEAAERVAVEHTQANVTRFVSAYSHSLIAMTHLRWGGDSATTPVVETEWSSMQSWEPSRWKQFLADERETAAAALRGLDAND